MKKGKIIQGVHLGEKARSLVVDKLPTSLGLSYSVHPFVVFVLAVKITGGFRSRNFVFKKKKILLVD